MQIKCLLNLQTEQIVVYLLGKCHDDKLIGSIASWLRYWLQRMTNDLASVLIIGKAVARSCTDQMKISTFRVRRIRRNMTRLS